MSVFLAKFIQMCTHLPVCQVPHPLVLCGDPTNLHLTPNGSLKGWWCMVVKNRAPPLF